LDARLARDRQRVEAVAELKNKVQYALDEIRILVLGTQVLLGFQFRGALDPGFERLSVMSQRLQLTALGLLVAMLTLFVFAGAFHRIAEAGQDEPRLLKVVKVVMATALAPFALVLGIEVFVVAERVLGRGGAWIAGSLLAITALACFYGHHVVGDGKRTMDESNHEGTPIGSKIRHVLTETRVALPGVQALVGFQVSIVLMETFDKLPYSSRVVHLIGLLLTVLAMVLLMAPAAYHRLAENGEETERFHQVATRFVVLAFAPMALGIAADLYVVLQHASGSTTLALTLSALAATAMLSIWLLVPFALRKPQLSAKADLGNADAGEGITSAAG
jgi:hypothetical protein